MRLCQIILHSVFLFLLLSPTNGQVVQGGGTPNAGAGLKKDGRTLSVVVDGITIQLRNDTLIVPIGALLGGWPPDHNTIDTTAGGLLRVKPGGLTTTQFSVRGTQLYWIVDTTWTRGLLSYVDGSNDKWFVVHVDSSTINIVNNRLVASASGTGRQPDYNTIDTTAAGLLKVKASGITTTELAPQSVQKTDIAVSVPDGTTIEGGGGDPLKVKTSGITSNEMAINSIDSTNMIDGGVSPDDIRVRSLTENQFASNSVDKRVVYSTVFDQTTIVGGSGTEVSVGLIDSSNITDGSVFNRKLADSSISINYDPGGPEPNTGITGGASVPLGGSVTLTVNVDGTIVTRVSDTISADTTTVLATKSYVDRNVGGLERDSISWSITIDSTQIIQGVKVGFACPASGITIYKVKAVCFQRGGFAEPNYTLMLKTGPNVSTSGLSILDGNLTVNSTTTGNVTTNVSGTPLVAEEFTWVTFPTVVSRGGQLFLTFFATR